MPLTNLFFWLILLLSGFAAAALLAAQFKAEQQARRQLIRLQLRRGIRHSSSQADSFRPEPDVLPARQRIPETAFLTVEYEPAADSHMPAVSYDWPRANRSSSEHAGQLKQSTESERHNCA